MEHFTPFSAAIGGALIGLSAVLLMALLGRIAGISGIWSGTVFAAVGDRDWRFTFVLGLIAAPWIYVAASGAMPVFDMQANLPMTVIAGLLVGFGTRLGSGCTSGHGVCGLSRLSPRSMVAVALFMGSGIATVAIARAVLGA